MSNEEQLIQELQQRYENLNTKKIQTRTNLENAEAELERLRAQAREKYDTDDVEELREKLATMKKENEKKRKDYEESLDEIERRLKKVEDDYSTASTGETDRETSE